jgi:hypothetical protein
MDTNIDLTEAKATWGRACNALRLATAAWAKQELSNAGLVRARLEYRAATAIYTAAEARAEANAAAEMDTQHLYRVAPFKVASGRW